MKKMKFIAIEGFDGCGKSSIAKMLAEKLNYEYQKTPDETFRKVREDFDDPKINLIERIAFYTGDCIRLSSKILNNEIKNLVVDRYYYSTIAYHQAKAPELIKLFMPYFNIMYKPDLVILVKVDFKTVIERINKRKSNDINDSLFLNENLFDKIYENFKSCIDVPILEIDNTGDLQKTLDTILQKLNTF